MSDRPHLCALADHVGILGAYRDLSGVEHLTSDETRQRLLTGMGFDVSSEASAERSFESAFANQGGIIKEQLVVSSADEGGMQIPLPDGAVTAGIEDVNVAASSKDNKYIDLQGRIIRKDGGRPRLAFSMPPDAQFGYYDVIMRLQGACEHSELAFVLAYAPLQCAQLAQAGLREGAFGVWANLYSLRSRRNWGVGDMGDLSLLMNGVGSAGGAVVGINPIHAQVYDGTDASPYAPISRLFYNEIYLDIEAIPEWSHCEAARGLSNAAESQGELEGLRTSKYINYPGVFGLKHKVQAQLFQTFVQLHGTGASDRGTAYHSYVTQGGALLQQYATYRAIGEVTGTWDVARWPAGLRDAESEEVVRFRAAHRQNVDRHCYIQFEIDRQLKEAAASGRAVGVGLYSDLALGASAGGFDAWVNPGLFAKDVELGAPPDPYSATGQTWGIPPIVPHRLGETGYRYWIDVLRCAMRHARLVRIDHVMGLFRQFWVPRGRPASEGAYVRYPAHDLLGILALESHRHNVAVVGEDLGTVPNEVPVEMRRRNILSTRVLWFEQDDNNFRPAESYPEHALVTATTHDLAPLPGLLSGRDIGIRDDCGLFESVVNVDGAMRDRSQMRDGLIRMLREAGLISVDENPSDTESLVKSCYAFLSRTRASLIAVSLDDLAGETDPVNIPGVGPDKFPSWSRRMRRTLKSIMSDPIFKDVMRSLHDARSKAAAGA